eukprot:762642-Hanusia_phi.AAC.2
MVSDFPAVRLILVVRLAQKQTPGPGRLRLDDVMRYQSTEWMRHEAYSTKFVSVLSDLLQRIVNFAMQGANVPLSSTPNEGTYSSYYGSEHEAGFVSGTGGFNVGMHPQVWMFSEPLATPLR